MYIYNKPVGRIDQVYREQSKLEPSSNKKKASLGQDKVTLSAEGKEMQAVFREINATEEIRPQVKELKKAISAGTYHVSSEKIADSMLKFLRQKV